MKKLTRNLIFTTLAMAILAYFLPEVNVVNVTTLILAGVLLGLLNSTVRPILKALFLPINLLTLGLFNWVINVVLLFVVTWLVPGFQIGQIAVLGWQFSGLWSLLVFSFGLSLVTSVIEAVL